MTKRILVVEDDPDIAKILREILEYEGYEISSATNGCEALSILRSGRPLPDLILLDLMMPVMDGFVFRRHQELDAALLHIPVVVMTAIGDHEARRKLNTAGFIRKPPELEMVLRVVNEHIL